MHKGFSLVELLTVIGLLGVFLVVFAPVFNMLAWDIPASCRVVQANTSVLNMLDRMRKDIDTASQLPESFAGHTTDDKLLLIEGADGVICYELKDGQVLRRTLTSAGEGAREQPTVWSVPNAKIEWGVWRGNGKGYAVEVKTHIEYYVGGNWQKKMANSHLYFVGAFRGASK